MSNSSNPILSTQNLAVGYKSRSQNNVILDDTNVSLFKGQLVCFMGPNGSGKSTLIRTITGIQKPLKGTILIDQRKLETIPIHELSKIVSVVLTDKINAGNLSVYELIAFGRYPHLKWNIS